MSRERRSVTDRPRTSRAAGTASLATLLALVLALPASAGAQERTAGVGAEARGWIGIGLRSTVTCEADGPGERPRDGSDCERSVLCETVVVDGPADRAGVQPGDVLLEIDGRSVLDPRGKFELPAFAPGETIALT
ncbi:MAG: PDZ domain-containing protein, partial [Gemmatimonadota bacterium]